MSTAAHPDDDIASVRERATPIAPIWNRQSAEAIGLLLGLLLILLCLVLAFGAPVGAGG
ncbi:MAG: hypothetical protein ACYDAN_08730 [Candidatus Limnocylindrales bacterium]